MELDTATRKSRWFRVGKPQNIPEFNEIMDIYWGGPERRITRLTVRIIGVNFAALIILLLGIIYLSQYQSALIESKLATFQAETDLIAAALDETITHDGDIPSFDRVAARRMIALLSAASSQRIFLFDAQGDLMADSRNMPAINYEGFDYEESDPYHSLQVLKKMAGIILSLLPDKKPLPLFPENFSPAQASDFGDVNRAMNGILSFSAWRTYEDEIILTAARPLIKNDSITGAIMIVRSGDDINEELGRVWLSLFGVFTLTLIVTVFLSIYLSGVIARPLRKLMLAAEAVRRGRSKDSEIPDLSHRKDEIGELSLALREMTQALWDRMDSIENFAADVAHELKNPLTSLRSAVETISVVKKDADKKKLLEIIKDDIERMDRLITDISAASRLDAELSRETLEPVNLCEVVRTLVKMYASRGLRAGKVKVEMRALETDLFVWGREGRLFQVLDNLVSNAVSFSPESGTVTVIIEAAGKNVLLQVQDQGPGIPESKLETVFERFYSERPQAEAFGKHSGLGLSICRQIVTAMGGRIWAANLTGAAGQITGARFSVILNGV